MAWRGVAWRGVAWRGVAVLCNPAKNNIKLSLHVFDVACDNLFRPWSLMSSFVRKDKGCSEPSASLAASFACTRFIFRSFFLFGLGVTLQLILACYLLL